MANLRNPPAPTGSNPPCWGSLYDQWNAVPRRLDSGVPAGMTALLVGLPAWRSPRLRRSGSDPGIQVPRMANLRFPPGPTGPFSPRRGSLYEQWHAVPGRLDSGVPAGMTALLVGLPAWRSPRLRRSGSDPGIQVPRMANLRFPPGPTGPFPPRRGSRYDQWNAVPGRLDSLAPHLSPPTDRAAAIGAGHVPAGMT